MAAKEYSSYNGITELRRDYEHFNKYLIGKQLSDDLILQAYKYEIKKFRQEEEIKIDLDDEYINKAASQCLFIVRDIVNSGKSEQTAIYIGALLKITGLSNWKELKVYFKKVKDFVNSIDQNAFDESPNEEFENLAFYHGLDNAQMDTFYKFLLLKLVRYVGQNWESPPVEGLIQGGIFENEREFISESTFKRYKGDIEGSNTVLSNLLQLLEEYKDDISGLLNIFNDYGINYKSTYIQRLGSSSNIAIKLPRFKNVDYESILAKANQNLSSLDRKHAIKEISMEKIVLFLFLVFYFDDPDKNEKINISNAKFSKLIGDSKVVSAIRDAFEQAKVFKNKGISKMEIKPTSFTITISFVVAEYLIISDPYLIDKLNQTITIKSGYFIEERLDFLNKVVDIINLDRPNKKLNFTQIFLKTGKTSPLLFLLKIITALKSKIRDINSPKIDANLKDAFDSIDNKLANELYDRTFNKFSGFLSSNRNYFGFHIPTLELVSNEDVEEELRNKFNESYIKDKSDEYLKEFEDKRIELMKPFNDDFIEKLKLFCRI